MKTSLIRLLTTIALLPFVYVVVAQPVPPTGQAQHQVSERGANYRVWSRVTAITNSLGRVHYRTNAYTELATGMHFWRDGQWHETKAEIELTDNGAAATNGPHKVLFAANVNMVASTIRARRTFWFIRSRRSVWNTALATYWSSR